MIQQLFLASLSIYWSLIQIIVLLLPFNNILTSLLGGVLILLFIFRQGFKPLNNRLNRWWLALSGWLIITTFTAFDPAIAWTGLFNFLPFFLLFAVTQFLITTENQFQHILNLLIISSIPISSFGLLQVIVNQPTWKIPQLFGSYVISLGMGDNRIASLFGQYNELGIYLTTIIIIAFGTLASNTATKLQKNLWRLAIILGFIAILYTGSRNSIALVFAGAIAVTTYQRHWYVLGGIIGSLTLFLWGALGKSLGIGGEWLRFLFPSVALTRLEGAINTTNADYSSTTVRLDIWKVAVKLIEMRPIQGWGSRSFELVSKHFGYEINGQPHEHNFYLTLAVAGGIPLLIGFVLLVGWILVKGFRAVNRNHLSKSTKSSLFAVVVAVGTFFLSGILDSVFYEPRLSVLCWILLAAIWGISTNPATEEPLNLPVNPSESSIP